MTRNTFDTFNTYFCLLPTLPPFTGDTLLPSVPSRVFLVLLAHTRTTSLCFHLSSFTNPSAPFPCEVPFSSATVKFLSPESSRCNPNEVTHATVLRFLNACVKMRRKSQLDLDPPQFPGFCLPTSLASS
ncbi:hypothetical protein Tsp_04715 [Trichinella spiralis]|uniref:hypothetical protein n=1 Tax=Trichinella spiralis TaxID=6334 RepID=UPI0001EFD9EA|nr:hypothetical protein Tsp_04715 [Trichinella spiralis]